MRLARLLRTSSVPSCFHLTVKQDKRGSQLLWLYFGPAKSEHYVWSRDTGWQRALKPTSSSGTIRIILSMPGVREDIFFCDNTFLSTTQCLLIRRANCANCANCTTCSWKVCPLCVFSCALSARQNVRTWQNNKINNNFRSWWQSQRRRCGFKSKHWA